MVEPAVLTNGRVAFQILAYHWTAMAANGLHGVYRGEYTTQEMEILIEVYLNIHLS